MHSTTCRNCDSPLSSTLIFCQSCGALIEGVVDPLLGEIIAERYRIKRELGRGGFSLVYQAERLSDGQEVALKILRSTKSDDSIAVKRFQRESHVCLTLEHPNVTQLYDVGQDGGGLFWISMDLLEGETLEAYMKRQQVMTYEELWSLFSPLLDALWAAHQKGIVHRDIKPQNLFLAKDLKGAATLKLLDFGLASFLEGDTLTQTGAVAGSPPFMPPEQWEGLARTDARSDLYALGMVMYWCLSGQLPFKASSALEWMKRHYYDQPLELIQAARLYPISSQLSEVVMRALKKRPEERYQSALEYKEALRMVGAEQEMTIDANALTTTSHASTIDEGPAPLAPQEISPATAASRGSLWPWVLPPLLLLVGVLRFC